jgi:hypothetical protein
MGVTNRSNSYSRHAFGSLCILFLIGTFAVPNYGLSIVPGASGVVGGAVGKINCHI